MPNPHGDPDQLMAQYQQAQAEYDPTAQIAYELAKMRYQEEREDRPRGGGLLGFLERRFVGEPDMQPVSAAMAAYFEEIQDAKEANRIKELMEKATAYRAERSGKSQDAAAALQAKVDMLPADLSPEQRQEALVRIAGGGSGVTVNTGEQANTIQMRNDLDLINKLRERASKSGVEIKRTTARVQELLTEFQQAGGDPGRLQSVVNKLGRYFNTKASASEDSIQNALMNVVLAKASELRPVTEEERNYIIQQMPGIGQSDQANMAIMKTLNDTADYAIQDYQDAVSTYQSNGSLLGWLPKFLPPEEQQEQQEPTLSDEDLLKLAKDKGLIK